jgi:hypothetical protein
LFSKPRPSLNAVSDLFTLIPGEPATRSADAFGDQLRTFVWNGRPTAVAQTATAGAPTGAAPAPAPLPTFINEFWTSRQRAAHSLHEVSYRACFKPQLPRFFIERLTRPGEVVYDPFMGRGTTGLEAALLGRVACGNDINPLSRVLLEPRLQPPALDAVQARLATVDWGAGDPGPDEFLTFYHPDTLREICALQHHLRDRRRQAALDVVDRWIEMVAVNRLTGHSPGFFSVYTLPPNQAASVTAQRKINAARGQTPPRREVPALILRKSRALLADGDGHARTPLPHQLMTGPASATPALRDGSVDLVVTSPPFLDVVNYAGDNWLRCWFCDIDPAAVALTVPSRLDEWRREMTRVFQELARVVRRGGYVAFEVGEVRGGRVRLEEHVIPCGADAGLTPQLVVINAQQFTKTAACWGVDNNAKGTNTNRIVVFERR